MSAQPKHTALTYGEIREWAVILGSFTASDLAREMGVDLDTGRRSVNALCMQQICVNTGDMLDGPYGYEPVIEYVPPPPGPTRHESGPDPVETAISQAGRISVQRGTPVRIRTERDQRRSLSTPGARQQHKNRERNYQRQEDAKEARAKAQQAKAQKAPKWKRNK
jgi:hypothetical protein